MKLPILFCIDDDLQVLRAITRDLKSHYRENYKILSTVLVSEALETLLQLKNSGDNVALFLSDQRMPEMEGIEFLEKAMEFFPYAKRLLLTAYSDTEAAIKAINKVQLDYYLVKPWDPPEEKLYPVIDGLLDDWKNIFVPEFKGIKVIGHQFSKSSYAIKEFLAGNLVPYHWVDLKDNKDAYDLLSSNKLDENELPVVFFEDGTFLVKPEIAAIAAKLGFSPQVKLDMYDVVIIGAGPAGLAAGVYGSSEGLKTLLIERHAPGGQAGTSSRIENYLGFPTGISGAELTFRAMTQATRLGTEFLTPRSVQCIAQNDGYTKIVLEDGSEINTRSVVITTGVDYRKLDTQGLDRFTGAGVYYGAANTEAFSCSQKEVFVVGGGNSAGQAAMYLSKFARSVCIIIRKEDLSSTMSAYLIRQIEETGNIRILPCTQITEAKGEEHLEELLLKDLDTGDITTVKADALYIFIGAKPYTDWIGEDILKDKKGFIATGRDLQQYPQFKSIWRQNRDPYLLETSRPGIFAAGDVRAGAMNRVASAVGEGSMAISFVHKFLAEVK